MISFSTEFIKAAVELRASEPHLTNKFIDALSARRDEIIEKMGNTEDDRVAHQCQGVYQEYTLLLDLLRNFEQKLREVMDKKQRANIIDQGGGVL